MPRFPDPEPRRVGRRDLGRWRVGLVAILVGILPAPASVAQVADNPVYVDDSTFAADALTQALRRLDAGDPSEAVRLLQEAIDREGDRLLVSRDQPELFLTVRQRLTNEILARPALLTRYRESMEPAARALLESGDSAAVARRYALTTAGFDATLLEAERRLEAARFDSAWRALVTLDAHPDRTGDRGARAGRLLGRILAYTDAAPAAAFAETWGTDHRVSGRVDPPRLNLGHTTLDPGPAVRLDDLVARALASAPLPAPAVSGAQQIRRSRPTRRAAGRETPLHYVLPTVTESAIYVNDGRTLSSLERYTLAPRWRVEFIPPDLRSATPYVTTGRTAIEDLATVSVSGRFAVAVGGIASRGLRDEDDRLHAVDTATGALRWSVTPGEISADLAAGSFRGPAVIDEGVVIIGVVKSVKERRLLSFHLAGLDLITGRTLWTRPLGSSGTLPYGAMAKIADLPAVADGLIFQMDSLGFIAAIETVTGRVRWLRRRPLQNMVSPIRRTWDGASPVVRHGVLYTIAPDRRDVLALDPETGALLGTRSTADFRDPDYLLGSTDSLVAVDDERIVALPFAEFDNPDREPRLILDARPGGIIGRVAVAGARVLAPTVDGVRVARVDAESPDDSTLAPLDRPGNVVALESELVVVDAAAVHTYLIWDVAERVLSERMAAHPNDPGPAVTFIDLAYRAGRPERVLPAVDAALNAIASNPLEEGNARARARLFESLWTIVTERESDRPTPLTGDLEAALVDRLGQAAADPPQRVRYLLARGAQAETNEDARDAVESYQLILDTPTLARARFQSTGVEARADLEATKGLTRVVQRFGPGAYQAYSDEADRALQSLNPSADPDVYAQLAQRYPIAPAAARAWLHAADRFERLGAPRRALAALEDGLTTADRALVEDDALIAELVGRLIQTQIESGRLEAAADTIARARREWPTLIPTSRGATIPIDTLDQQVTTRLASARRRARITPPAPDAPVSLLTGWIIQRPILASDHPVSTESIVLRNDAGLGLFRIDPAGGMHHVWSAQLPVGSSILADTWDAVYTLEPGARGRRFSRFDRASGALVWRTDDLNDLLPETGAALPTLPTFAIMDHRSLALVRSDGAAAAYDLATGERLWFNPMILPDVAEAAADADTLLVIGDKRRPLPQNRADPPAPVAVTLDLRSGTVTSRFDPGVGQPLWTRLTPDGDSIIGGLGGVAARDLLRETRLWLADELAGLRTADAWPVPGRILILDDDAGLWQIDTGDERPAVRDLDTQGRLARALITGAPIRVASIGDDVVLASTDGLLVYDRAGALVGMDRRGDDSAVTPAAIGERFAVAAAVNPAEADAEALWHDLFIFELPSAALAQRRLVNLEARPDDVALLDGRILLSAGKATLVIDASPP